MLTSCALIKRDGYARDYEECSSIEKCAEVIKAIIEHSWYIPDSYTDGLMVKLRVKLSSNKTVTSISILESSGNREFDMSAVEAVKNLHTIVELNGLDDEIFEQNFRQFVFAFKP